LDREGIARRVEILKSELVRSQGKIFDDHESQPCRPESKGQIGSAIRLLVDRINLLPIHIRTGIHKKSEYVLHLDIVFSNSDTRVIVSDHLGIREAESNPMALPVDPDRDFLGHFDRNCSGKQWEKWGYTFNASDSQRHEIIRELINLASDQWKERLKTRFEAVDYKPVGCS
jgi:hypothetical protein